MDTSFVKISAVLENNFLSNVESPIELKLLSALKKFGVKCVTQKIIGNYRADIFIESKYRDIVVECDGKEFHKDKSKDAKRDEFMRKVGITVLRFTGSEINKNAEDCAHKIIEYISEIYSSPEYQGYHERYLRKQTEKFEDDSGDEYENDYELFNA